MTDHRARRARIVATIGPASRDATTVRALIDHGLDVARLNFSHGSHADHEQTIATIRGAAAEAGRNVAILQDLQGPKIRVGEMPDGQIPLEDGSIVILTGTPGTQATAERIPVSHQNIHNDVNAGETILLDDGNLSLLVLSVDGQDVHAQVTHGGLLKDHKGLNLPGSILSVPSLSDKDKQDLAFGLAAGVDLVAMSFVQRPQDLIDLKALMSDYGRTVPVIAKIEKPQAVEQLDAILDETDAIMVARGDLGVEMAAEEVPLIQKRIIRACNLRAIPVITATQMLESMIDNPRPTRAEASDVANAILDGTDAVMLSGETAAGKFPVESVDVMHRIVSMTEQEREHDWDRLRRDHASEYSAAETIGYAACHAADMINAKLIACLTQGGSTARMAASYRPQTPILALSANAHTCRQLALVWGVDALHTPDFESNSDVTIEELKGQLLASGHIKSGDHVIFTSGLPFSARRDTNTLRIETIH